MTGKLKNAKNFIVNIAILLFITSLFGAPSVEAADDNEAKTGGGYAASGQSSQVGYTAMIYDASNGLITSDANYCMCASDGTIWIGGYSGILRYDGSSFERLDTSDGLTSGRGLFEDSRGRIFVGTNDNGVVVIDGDERIHYTYKDGLSSESIRVFAEDDDENVFIGTTAGVAYINNEGQLFPIDDERINNERVLRLDADASGKIYGQTKNGIIFAIEDCKVTDVYESKKLGMATITSILADPVNTGWVYIATEDCTVFYGPFGESAINMKRISVNLNESLHWISYDCGRIWLSTKNALGYLDEYKHFHEVKNLPMNSSIEMTTSDYQGNLWVASSTQGIMKVVTNNFLDVFEMAGISGSVTNAVCLYKEKLYIGMDLGLYIVDSNFNSVENALTDYLKDTRIRCIMADSRNNLWISTFTDGMGLICVGDDGKMTAYTADNGLPGNEVRGTTIAKDGSILVCTNSGLAIIKDGSITECIDAEDGIKNTTFLTAVSSDDGTIYVGSDGDGIYKIQGKNIARLSREDGLTSDVIMKIKWDDESGVLWLVTSNSIEYMKNGIIYNVSTFPYNNNFDVYFDDGYTWVFSACGIYKVKTDELINDNVKNYRLYTLDNGLPYAITSNSYSVQDENGNLYISGRRGVIRVNTNCFFEGETEIKAGIKAVYCGDTIIQPDENGRYVIPPSKDRIRIQTSVMDYTMLNPLIRIYLEGSDDNGITMPRSDLSALEYTGLKYGNYKLHIQVISNNEKDIILDDVFEIVKKARFTELLIFKIIIFLVLASIVGFAVYKIMNSTIISRQYEEIRAAKDEAERANTAKTRFLANISHEIRTPINTIMGMNEMIMREDPTGVPKGYFMSMMNYAFDIQGASESLLGLISDLLDMSKIESGKMHLVEKEYDLQDMLRAIVSMIRIRSTQKELTFDVVVDEMLPRSLYGDDGKIKQVVLNMLTNAVKYTKHGGFILNVTMVKRDVDNCDIRFLVKDTGIGIKEEDMEKLFTAYERLDEEKNSGIQGTGLGLDISRRFAELMGGSLKCESVYGEGSEFTLSITQKIIDDTPIGVFKEHDDTAAKGPYVPKFIAPDADILVVDDNPMNLNVMKGLLKATKVFVTTASSGAECLEKIEESRYDVVFLDHMMPEMDGVETLSRIREIAPDLPVYALTANTGVGEDFYTSKGFNGYLTKPVDSRALETVIMKHLPEEMMEKPEAGDVVEELKEIPEELKWIYGISEISVDDGIKNSGGIGNFIFSLKLFLDTIDGNAKVIRDAYDSGNISLYTIKVHALKSSARIIGAEELAGLSEALEEAGKRDDLKFIKANMDRFMLMYQSFKVLLCKLEDEYMENDDREEIPADELSDAYNALKDVVPQMDYDAVELIIAHLKEYKLPKDDAEKLVKLEKLLRNFDWDEMGALIADSEN